MAKVRERTTKSGTTTYFVHFYAAGHETSERFDTRAKAEWFSRLITDIGGTAAQAHLNRRDRNHEDYIPTLEEWTTRHIQSLTGVTERTRIDYQRLAARTWLRPLGKHELDTITRDDIGAWINTADKAGLSAKSIANAHGLLSAVLGSALAEGHVDRNVAHRRRLPRSREEERRDERFLTHAEYAALIDALPAQHRPLAVLLFGTGLRWSEATALTIADVTFTSTPPTLRVTKAWKVTPGKPAEVGPPKSRKSRRTVMLPRQVVAAIEPLTHDRHPNARLFTALRGGPVRHNNWRERVWVPANITAGLATPRPRRNTDPAGWAAWSYDGPRIHDARHSHASWLIEQGATLEMVQDQLGHESILTTRKVYGHLQPAMRAQLAAMATKALEPPE